MIDIRSIGSTPFVRWTAGLLLIAGIGLMLIARFQNVNPVVFPFLQMAADPSLYAADVYLRNAIVAGSSPLFPLLAAVRFDITQPAPVVALYLLAAALGGWAVHRLLTEALGVRDRLTALMLLFLAIFADAKLMAFHKGGWIFEHNFSLTMLAATGRLWFVYAALTGRSLLMTAVLIPINLFTFKVGWPLVLIAGALMLWRRERAPWPWLLLALSMVGPAWAALSGSADLSMQEARAVLDTLKAAHATEDDPFAISWASKLLFAGGVAFLAWRATAFPEPVRSALRVTAAVSVAIFVGGGLYLAFSALLPPVPAVVLLSPARALETATLLAYLVALVEVARARSLKATEKVPLLLALAILKVTPDLTWIALALALTLAAGAVWVVRTWAERRVPIVGRLASGLSLPLLIGLAAPLMGAVFALNLTGGRMVHVYQTGLGFRDASIPAEASTMLAAMRQEQADRRRVFIRPIGDGWEAVAWNAYARSSGMVGDVYYLPTPALIERQTRMNTLVGRLVAELESGRVSAVTAVGLGRCHAHLVAPRSAAPALPGWTVVKPYGGWAEFKPPPTDDPAAAVC